MSGCLLATKAEGETERKGESDNDTREERLHERRYPELIECCENRKYPDSGACD
jgi:hypothetical protein